MVRRDQLDVGAGSQPDGCRAQIGIEDARAVESSTQTLGQLRVFQVRLHRAENTPTELPAKPPLIAVTRTANQYLTAGLVDELRLHIAPLTLHDGTRLFDRVPALNLEQLSARTASNVIPVTYRLAR